MTNALRFGILTVIVAVWSSPSFAQDTKRKPIPVVIDIDSVDGASVNAERMRSALINAISGSPEFRYLANPALTGETNYLKWYWLTLKSVASSGREAATAFGGALTYHAPGVPLNGVLIVFGITECGPPEPTDCSAREPLRDTQEGVKLLREASPALYDSLTK